MLLVLGQPRTARLLQLTNHQSAKVADVIAHEIRGTVPISWGKAEAETQRIIEAASVGGLNARTGRTATGKLKPSLWQ